MGLQTYISDSIFGTGYRKGSTGIWIASTISLIGPGVELKLERLLFMEMEH